jgi:predicted amidophosphoribosyltransferase
MTDAQKAYKEWKQAQKVSMMVYTDEQMFEIGFNAAQELIKELAQTILAMEKDAKKMNSEIQKLKKAKQS